MPLHISGGGSGNRGIDGIRMKIQIILDFSTMSLAHFRNYDADWELEDRYVF